MQNNAIALPDEYRDLLSVLGYVYLQNGHAERAVILFNALHALDPEQSSIVNSLAWTSIHCGKAEEALILLDHRLQHSPTSPITHLLRSKAMIALGRSAEGAHSMQLFVRARREQAVSGEE